MTAVLWLLPVLLAAALAGAHFWRAGDLGLQLLCWAAPALLLVPRRWAARAVQALLLGATTLWLDTAFRLASARAAHGLPWARLVAILGAVAALTAASTLVFRASPLRRRYREAGVPWAPSTAAFLLTAAAVGFVHLRVAPPMLVFERLAPGLGWLEVLVLAAYAGVVTEALLDPRRVARWRVRVWGLFSVVFFGQALLGLLGVDELLLTGRLHPPVPALIVGGPLYRGNGLFMPLLFAATLLLVGPAWCSHLCYVGAWDAAAAGQRRRPQRGDGLARAAPFLRWLPWLNLVAGSGVALALRGLGVPSGIAAALGITFGLAGVAVMLAVSRRAGVMAHCAGFCPIGPVATTLGRLSPFRLRLTDACTDCGACTGTCRYAALSDEDIRRRRPGRTCTLCGDCLASCRTDALELSLPGVSPRTSRAVFLVLVVSLHAAFLGLARL